MTIKQGYGRVLSKRNVRSFASCVKHSTTAVLQLKISMILYSLTWETKLDAEQQYSRRALQHLAALPSPTVPISPRQGMLKKLVGNGIAINFLPCIDGGR